MTISALIRIALPFALGVAAGSAFAADPKGQWSRGDGNARVKVAACGAKLCATNTWIRDTSSGEAVGDRLVMSLKDRGAGRYTGEAFDAKRDLTFAFEMRVNGSTMVTRGCIVGGLLCKSANWSRLD